jgi:3-oxoacyl-[acyl-carrier protein] reductase
VELGLDGKVALVTGASRGIGRSIAAALGQEGARVALAARSRPDLEQAAAACNGLAVAADLTTEAGCRSAVEQTLEELGTLDILVNNLGTRSGTGWDDTGVAEFEDAMRGNLYPAVRMSQLVLPEMRRRGWGRIVVISSIYGRESGGPPAYNAAKAAEISFTTSLGRAVARDGVTVNCVAPGSIIFEGGSWHRRQQADPDGIAAFVDRELPLGRFGRPEEVATAVVFLCSPAAGLVNGACLPVDGGQSRSNI